MDLSKQTPRFAVERHTEHPVLCFRVRDLKTGETYGFGLNPIDAVHLAVEHQVRADSEGAL